MRGIERGRQAILVPAASVGLLLLVWAASAGPAAVLSPSGRTRTFSSPTASASASEPVMGGPDLEELVRGERTDDLSWIGDLLAWAVVLGALAAVAAGLRYAVRHRWRRAVPPPVVDVEPLPEVAAARALAEDADSRLAALASGDPRNGIVRCWLRLEESVAAAGLPRQPHETSAEFTVRVLHVLDLDPRAIGDLARLYREARFSEHALTEDARAEARAALDTLQHDLADLPAERSGR